MLQRLLALDVAAFRALHQGLFGTPAGAVLATVQRMGEWRGMAVLLVASAVLAPRGRRATVVLRILASVLLASLLCDRVKRVVNEPRPASRYPDLLAPAFWLGPSDDDSVRHARSWPSGHTTAAFAFAAAVLALGAPRRATGAAFCLASGTALGRVVLGAHFPSDVLAGALLGTLVGWQLGRPLDLVERRLAERRALAGPPPEPSPARTVATLGLGPPPLPTTGHQTAPPASVSSAPEPASSERH